MFQSGTRTYSCPPPLQVLMSKCEMHNIFRNYSSHKYIKIRSTLHPIFLEEHTLLDPLAIKLKSVIRTARSITQAGCITMPSHYFKKYTPMLEHGFLPLINDHLFRHPPPPNNAMLAFPQEKNSHYTTVWEGGGGVLRFFKVVECF